MNKTQGTIQLKIYPDQLACFEEYNQKFPPLTPRALADEAIREFMEKRKITYYRSGGRPRATNP